MVACRVAVSTLQPAGLDHQDEWVGCRHEQWAMRVVARSGLQGLEPTPNPPGQVGS